MLRAAFTVFSGLVIGAVSGVPAESDPRVGLNFTVVKPAITMIWIAPGTFWMSSTHGAGDDTEVTLTRGYWLGRTEVTQAQWQDVIEHVPVPSFFKGSDRPVERVSWETAALFCVRLTDRERAAGRLPPGHVYSLPTEAQWEYGCRAGTSGSYAGPIEAIGWYDANSGGQTQRVALKQPNAWGLHDMHGNVFEWCADWYGGYPGGKVNDPGGLPVGQFRVFRGGGLESSRRIGAFGDSFLDFTQLQFSDHRFSPRPRAARGRAGREGKMTGNVIDPGATVRDV